MVKFCPIISEIQKIYVYETYTRLYLVGSDYRETKFRILKIDRTEPQHLIIHEEQVAYNFDEIKDLLEMVDLGNRTKVSLKNQGNQIKNITAYGIVGFIRFLAGYYIVLVTKKRKVAVIGHHNIYKIEDSQMLYIPNNPQGSQNPEEIRLVKMFQTIDLSSNFYYSYSYDLTNSLQQNLCIADQKEFFRELLVTSEGGDPRFHGSPICGYKSRPNPKYVWNRHLLEPWESRVHFDWCLAIIHGFVKQAIVSIFGRNVIVTLLARRSCYFAGTRYLKRGVSVTGQVANEVETEQILQDDLSGTGLSADSLDGTFRGVYSSYVQTRGSVPAFWAQEASKMVPKPPIVLNNSDPFCQAAGSHFKQLITRFGTPLIAFNLAKNRETKKGEGIICDEFKRSVQYLNQFIPTKHRIIYHCFDLARMNRNKSIDVIKELGQVCDKFVIATGFYLRGRKGSEPVLKLQTGVIRSNCVDCLDRTNTAQFVIGKCAMFRQLRALGILEGIWHVGEGADSIYDYESDATRLLEDMYEEHGDVLAMQYGGSQLVHRVDTYRKISPWASHSRDMMQTFSRYYSNTFSDADKQNAINLFLGVYVPSRHGPPLIWDLSTDFHLHNMAESGLARAHGSTPTCFTRFLVPGYDPKTSKNIRTAVSYCRWYDREILGHLPAPYSQVCLDPLDFKLERFRYYTENHRVDSYYELYRPYEYTSFVSLFILNVATTTRDYLPSSAKLLSPFVTRKISSALPGPFPSDDVTSSMTSSYNPDQPGQTLVRKCSVIGPESSEHDYVVLDPDTTLAIEAMPEEAEMSSGSSFEMILDPKITSHQSNAKCTFGQVLLQSPSDNLTRRLGRRDRDTYKAYARAYDTLATRTGLPMTTTFKYGSGSDDLDIVRSYSSADQTGTNQLNTDSVFSVTMPTVSQESESIYRNCIKVAQSGPNIPDDSSLSFYRNYLLGYPKC